MICIFLLFINANCLFKISHLNALVQFSNPHSKYHPNFTLTAEGECVKDWISTDPYLIKVTPLYEGYSRCSNKAVVESVYSEGQRKFTQINAISETGVSLQCNIYIDTPKRISILTSTKTIFLDGMFQILFLQGFDENNNIFTALSEDSLNWYIDNNKLRVIKDNDANLLETSKGLVIQGKVEGKAWVKAALGNDLETTVELTVIKEMFFFPSSTIVIVPERATQLKLCSTKGVERKCEEELDLSSGKYLFKSSNESVAIISNSGLLKTFISGSSSIMAINKDFPESTAVALVKVCVPSSGFVEDQWIVIGSNPEFDPILYDENNEFFNYDIQFEIDGRWDSVGKHKILLRYFSFVLEATVYVCDYISSDSDVVHLPVESQWFDLNITGGSGYFEYSAENQDMLQNIERSIKSKKYMGETNFMVTDLKIPNLVYKFRVIITAITKAEIILNEREIFRNEYFSPVCNFFYDENNAFTVNINYNIVSADKNIVSDNLQGINRGFTFLSCSYGSIYSEQIKVLVFDPIVSRITGIASPNSKVPLAYSDGPLSWGNALPKYTVSCGEVPVTTTHEYFIVESEFTGECTLSAENIRTDENQSPLLTTTVFSFSVFKPYRVEIRPVDPKASNFSKCRTVPSSQFNNLIHYSVPYLHEIMFYCYVLNTKGNIINYHSADPLNLYINKKSIDIEGSNERTGATVFKYTVEYDSIVELESPNISPDHLNLTVIHPLSIELSKTIFFKQGESVSYKLTGGSGYYDFDDKSLNLVGNNVIVYPKYVGFSRYSVVDLCTNQGPIEFELNSVTINRLVIRAPNIVPLGSSFNITMECFDRDGNLISPETISKLLILKEPSAVKIKDNTWSYKPSSNGTIIVRGQILNITDQTSVEIINTIQVNPVEITILPGESKEISVSGHSSLRLDCTDDIVSINSFSVTGVKPGTTSVMVYSPISTSIPPFYVKVVVLNPLRLEIVSPIETAIQNSQTVLALLVHTELGQFYPSCSTWSVDHPYNPINSSHIHIQFTKTGTTLVSASAFQLVAKVQIRVIDKLVLNVPRTILLPPGCSFDVTSESSAPFELNGYSDVISVSGTTIMSKKIGNTIVQARYDNQITCFVVDVIEPSYFFMKRVDSTKFTPLLFDQNGREFTSTRGISILVEGDGLEQNINQSDDIIIDIRPISNTDEISFTTTLYTDLFTISTTSVFHYTSSISPEDPTLIIGSQYIFKCPSLRPSWKSSNQKVVTVTRSGLVRAVSVGDSILHCDSNISTNVKVIDISAISIYKRHNDIYQIVPEYRDHVQSSLVVYPDDLKLSCQWSSNNCGHSIEIVNSSGYFCKIERAERLKCPEKSHLKATLTSTKGSFSLFSSISVPFAGSIDFGVPNEYTLVIDPLTKKGNIPLQLPRNEMSYYTNRKIHVAFGNDNSASVIALEPGKIRFIHNPSKEYINVNIIIENYVEEKQSIFHEYLFSTQKDMLIICSILLIFICVIYGYVSP